MEPSVAALVLLSAVLHPLWNALIKRGGGPEASFLGLMVMIALLSLVTVVVIGADLMAARKVWHLVLVSAFGLVLYGSALVMTLRRGDLSAYYPIVRSSPVFIVVVSAVFLGQSYAAPVLLGIAMVVVGAFFLQYRPGARLLDDPRTLMFAVLAMGATGIYSISDAFAMQVVEPPVFLFWVTVLFVPAYAAVVRSIGGPSLGWRGLFAWVRMPWRSAGTGLIAFTSYSLILTAYAWGGEVAAVSSLRQASIPISVLIGGLWLGEAGLALRLAASLLLAAGIVVIVLAG
jgi:drug/metabolite transporter (DMT)-like permease